MVNGNNYFYGTSVFPILVIVLISIIPDSMFFFGDIALPGLLMTMPNQYTFLELVINENKLILHEVFLVWGFSNFACNIFIYFVTSEDNISKNTMGGVS